MNTVVRIGALVLALATGYLAYITAIPALAPGLAGPLYAGQVRGLIFAAAMTAATVGLLWVATRPMDRGSR